MTAPDSLSAQEITILQLLARGEPQKLIADTLHISLTLLKNHRLPPLFAKLGVRNKEQAIVWAALNGLASLPEAPCLNPTATY